MMIQRCTEGVTEHPDNNQQGCHPVLKSENQPAVNSENQPVLNSENQSPAWSPEMAREAKLPQMGLGNFPEVPEG